jgi:hypothetical protein
VEFYFKFLLALVSKTTRKEGLVNLMVLKWGEGEASVAWLSPIVSVFKTNRKSDDMPLACALVENHSSCDGVAVTFHVHWSVDYLNQLVRQAWFWKLNNNGIGVR